jgi:hypothetical protein
MTYPAKLVELSMMDDGATRELWLSTTIKRSRYAMCVVILPEPFQLSIQVEGIPEKDLTRDSLIIPCSQFQLHYDLTIKTN